MEETDQSVEFVIIAEHMVPAAHWLVVLITPYIAGSHVILGQGIGIKAVGRGIVRQYLLADGTEPICRNDVAGKWIANVSRSLAARCTRVGGHRVKYSVLAKVL